MNFQDVEYLQWFKNNHPKIEYDLASSSAPHVTQKELNILLDNLDLGNAPSSGNQRLIELISEVYSAEKDDILITSGSTHANYLICALLISEKDEVIVEKPVYTPLLDTVLLMGAKVKFLYRKFEENYNLNLERLAEMISKNTKLIVLTNLNNPTGNMIDAQTLKSLCEIAEDNKIHVLSDEVYRDFIFSEYVPTFSSLTHYGITTCSLSKFYGAGALRVGWALCEPELVKRARKFNDYIVVHNSCAGEQYGAMVLEKRDWFVERNRKIVSTNLPIVDSWIEKRDDLEWVKPKYGIIGFPRLLGNVNSNELAGYLLHNFRTMLVPGWFFGDENHIRIAFGGNKENLKKGIENVNLALDKLDQNRK